MLKMDVDAGRYADLVAVNADRVKDIHALSTLHFVMKGGVVARDKKHAMGAQ